MTRYPFIRFRMILLFAALTSLLLTSPTAASDGKAYGEPLTGSDIIAISALMADPDPHIGETVRVEGLITGVCEKRGCWISLASDDEFEELRIKAEDGVIVFPMSTKGKKAVAEGVFAKIEMTLEQTVSYRKHQAEEHGTEFDPDSVTEPLVFYQINVTGAVVR